MLICTYISIYVCTYLYTYRPLNRNHVVRNPHMTSRLQITQCKYLSRLHNLSTDLKPRGEFLYPGGAIDAAGSASRI